MRVGVDIGGTFTDAVAISADGTIQTAKALTTPGHLHDGVLTALEQLEVDWGTLEGREIELQRQHPAELIRSNDRITLIEPERYPTLDPCVQPQMREFVTQGASRIQSVCPYHDRSDGGESEPDAPSWRAPSGDGPQCLGIVHHDEPQ